MTSCNSDDLEASFSDGKDGHIDQDRKLRCLLPSESQGPAMERSVEGAAVECGNRESMFSGVYLRQYLKAMRSFAC